jgi:IS5 family transposase
MKYRSQGGGGDLFAFIDHQRKARSIQRPTGIRKLSGIVDWEGFRDDLEGLLGYGERDGSKGGRPPFDPVFMFRVLVLQKFHGLSDAAVEEQIADRFSFMDFLGLKPGDDIPDENTVWDFREALERDGREGSERLFERFNEMLEARGLIGREGSLVDASFVDAPRQRNTREQNGSIKKGERPAEFDADTARGRQKDCEARWAKKNNETHFGYKNHAKVDAKSKLITRAKTTPANVHDSQEFKDLVDKTDNAAFADSAYASEEAERYLLEDCDCEEFIMMKGRRGHPLTREEKATNTLRSRIRVRVEHVFGRMSQMGMGAVRTIGLKRASQHNTLSNLVYNMDRYAFLTRKPA